MPETKTVTKTAAVTTTAQAQKTVAKRAMMVDLVKQIQEHEGKQEETWFDASKLLYDIHTSEVYKTWNFETFKDYCTRELGLQYRIAMYRRNKGEAIVKFKFTKEDLKGWKWTSFKELLRLFNPDMTEAAAHKLLDKAKGMSYNEVVDFVATHEATAVGGAVSTKTKLDFTLMNEQAHIVEQALEKAAKRANLDPKNPNRGAALEYICLEWLMNNDPELKAKLLPKLHIPVVVPTKHKEHANKGKKTGAKKVPAKKAAAKKAAVKKA